MKRFENGLVVGKFAPLHKGHEFLINTAKDQCENVYILSYGNPELPGYESSVRSDWLRSLYPEIESWVIDPLTAISQIGQQLPLDTDVDDAHRDLVAKAWLRWVNKPLDAVFTSEAYGDGFAEYLTKYFALHTKFPSSLHVLVDMDRKAVPISGSQLRKDIHGLKEYLSPAVYSSFVKRVCFLGAECTGKSTITEQAAKGFNTNFVSEFGRDLWIEKGGQLEYQDMVFIAKQHVKNERIAAELSNKFLFVDTSPLTTLLYSYHLFGKADEDLIQLSHRPYDQIFLCSADFEFVQDGTRAGNDFRLFQHQEYLRILRERGLDYVLLEGSLDRRLEAVSRKVTTNRLRP